MMRPRGCHGGDRQHAGRCIMRQFGLLISVVVMVLVGSMAPTTPMAVIAQQSTPDTEASIPPLLMAWAEAWSSGDPAQVAALYAEDGVYEEIPTNVVAQGPDEIEAF